jgi:exopolysaccharide production protein ExoQ
MGGRVVAPAEGCERNGSRMIQRSGNPPIRKPLSGSKTRSQSPLPVERLKEPIRLNQDAKTDASRFEKFYVIAVLFFSTGAFAAFWSDPSAVVAPKENATDRVIWIVLHSSLILLLLLRAKRILRLLARQRFVALFLLWVLASATWSDAPYITVKRALALVLSTLFGVYVAERFTLKQQMKYLLLVLAAVALLSLAAGLFFPRIAIMDGADLAGCWRGILVHKNSLGRLMVLLAVLSYLTEGPKPIRYCAIVLAIILLGLAGSGTSIVALFLLGAFLPLANLLRLPGRKLLQIGITLSVLFVALGTWVVSNAGTIFYFILDKLGKNATLSGRGPLWVLSLQYVSRRPWLGFGYSAFWLGSDGQYSSQIWKLLRWEVPHSHNGFIDLCLNVGLIGLGIFLLLYSAALWKSVSAFRERRSSECLWIVMFLVSTILANLTESGLVGSDNLFWFTFISLTYSLEYVGNCAHTSTYRDLRKLRLHADHPQYSAAHISPYSWPEQTAQSGATGIS